MQRVRTDSYIVQLFVFDYQIEWFRCQSFHSHLLISSLQTHVKTELSFLLSQREKLRLGEV